MLKYKELYSNNLIRVIESMTAPDANIKIPRKNKIAFLSFFITLINIYARAIIEFRITIYAYNI